MKKLAIVVAGGPAPGINSVIAAATIRACLDGVQVLGIQDGFKWLAEGDLSHVVPLTIADTSRIHFRGGSYIGISRANPTRTPEHLQRTLDALERLDVGMLITIGGDGTATLAQISLGEDAGEGPGHSRPQDDRQRHRPAPRREHLRVPDRAPRGGGDRQEPHGRREDHLALVLRRRPGTQGGAPRPVDRQGGGGDHQCHPRGVPPGLPRPVLHGDRHPRRLGHQAAVLRPPGWNRPARRGARRLYRPRGSGPAHGPPARPHGEHPCGADQLGGGPREGRGGAVGRPGNQGHPHPQVHRVRGALRGSHSLRHGVHARSRLLRGPVHPRWGVRGSGLHGQRAVPSHSRSRT